ncbi:MAG: glycosyltransferase family 2 protein [Lentisphaeria bacterium]|nr:glycosyltransferase family 2 protein [Lentisphaeria bacterium]
MVVPCYNEESILENSIGALLALLEELRRRDLAAEGSCLLLVDDGSSDRTWQIIQDHAGRFPGRVRGISFAANRGHQTALLAGLSEAVRFADVTVSLDADLQDDINVIPEFMREYINGNDIVYGVRGDRSSDPCFKRFTAESFYRILRFMGVKTVFNHADFRLMSARAVKELLNYSEVNLYLRGLVPLIGFRQSIVMYTRQAADRPTHYPLRKMLMLAWEGITSFSIRPIRAITVLGLLMFVVCIGLLGYIMYSKFLGATVPGWTSLAMVSLLLGGFQLVAIGIIGEYIAKIYLEVKRRPRFCIREKAGFDVK